jgi:hypothetical protein
LVYQSRQDQRSTFHLRNKYRLRFQDKVAVNAQLVSTETGAHIWADRFEGERANLGQLQIDIVSRLANALGVELVKAESLRSMRERPDNPDAADLAMQGWALFGQVADKQRFNDSMKLFERALALDAQNVGAMTGLANVLHWRASGEGGAFQWVQAPPGDPLQPEATGAVMEVTKWLKPSV